VNVSVVFSPFFWGESDAFCSKGQAFALLCLGFVEGFRSDSENDMGNMNVDSWQVSVPPAQDSLIHFFQPADERYRPESIMT
jgi:hypothetical protein